MKQLVLALKLNKNILNPLALTLGRQKETITQLWLVLPSVETDEVSEKQDSSHLHKYLLEVEKNLFKAILIAIIKHKTILSYLLNQYHFEYQNLI